MSSLVDCHNQSTSAPISESDNDDENAFDSLLNRQNESMMHKVKDVVSKLLHPSFLFSTTDDTDRPKRKRSTSVEEQQTTTTTTDLTNSRTTISRSRYGRSTIRDDGPQLTDDEDSNSRDVPSTEQDSTEIEQQKKRRRTANYQHILSTNGHDDERTSSPLTSTDTVRSLSNRRIDPTSPFAQTPNRFTPTRQRFDILPTYRGSTSNYDPTKSPLFSAGNRKTTETTTTLKSDEFSANYLLASSLVSRSQTSSSQNQKSPATLTHPTDTNRQLFGVNYSSINSRRLPYIERLRRRTLQDCIRLNRTVDSEPLSESVIEEHKSTTTSPVLKRIKTPDKDCGIQCDISIEPNKKIQHTFPPADIRNEAITENNQSSIQTNSSITIERVQPKIDITKPKVLGNVTPFSWPKFARAQEEYAKKYPEKCRADAVVPTKPIVTSNSGSSNVNMTPSVPQQTTTGAMPMSSFSASHSTRAIWKCPSCTKEHPAQTATCSLCRQINPDYKKPSAIEPTVTTRKEPAAPNKLPDIIAKEPSVPAPVTNPITTKESVLPSPPATTTSTHFPMVGVTPSTLLPVTTKENPTVITSSPATLSFGTMPIVSTTKETPVTTASSTIPLFGIPPIVSTTTKTQDNPVSTSAAPLSFGTTPIIATTKENPVTTSTPFMFGTTAPSFDKNLPISTNTPFPTDRAFQPFLPVTSTSPTPAVTTSTVPSFTTITPSLPTTVSFGTFSSTSVTPPPATTTAAAAAPVVSTVSFVQPPAFTFASSTSVPSLPTTIGTFSASFGSPPVVPTLAVTTSAVSFAASSASPFTTPSSFALPSTTTTTTTAPFGSGGFGLTTGSPLFAFGASTSPKSTAVAFTNPVTTPAFGAIHPFGSSTTFGTINSFGSTSTSVDRPASTVSSALPFGGSNTTSPFGFGSAPSTIQTSASAAPTSGFVFSSPASSVPIFGAGPPPLLSGGTSSPFMFSGGSVASSTAGSTFPVSGIATPLPSDPFASSNLFDSTEASNPFSIGDTESSPASRPMLKAKRRRP